jgi:plastocyanin
MRVLLSIAALIVSALPLCAGDVSGQVVITRRISRKTLAPTVYNLRGATPPAAAAEPVNANEFARTLVMLESGKLSAPAPVTAVIEQRDTRFEPDLLVVPVGSTVQFPNFDPIFHNVFSLSATQSFDLGFYPRTQTRSVKFSHPGVVQVYCHIHSHMYAGIVVTASPFSTRPADDGSFSFANVPAGHYRLVAWHKIAGLHKVELDVPELGAVTVKIRVPVDVEQ